MIYLDHNATTPVKKEVADTIYETMQFYSNPNSQYSSAIKVRKMIEKSREIVADCIGASPDEIYFTSSGSESNSMALQREFITTKIEHSSILLNPLARPLIAVDKRGFVDLSSADIPEKSLVSIQAANNEIGTIQNLNEISRVLHEKNCVLHSDMTQLLADRPINVKKLGIDMATFSGHKIGAPKGIGFLYKRDGITIKPVIYGTQEQGLRGGTENVPYILGLAKAFELIQYPTAATFYEHLRQLYAGVQLNGADIGKNRLRGNLNCTFAGVRANVLLSLLDDYGVCVSSGSACKSFDPAPSHVLKAIGLTDEQCEQTIRIGIGNVTTDAEIAEFLRVLEVCLKKYWAMYN